MAADSRHTDRIARARRALSGLALGDAFGEQFFAPPMIVLPRLESRRMDAEGLWRWTDDTAMALSIVEELEARQEIQPDSLATRFFDRYQREPWRGYGGGAHRLFERISQGEDWEVVAHTLFDSQGSFGNGGAMRVAPLGAYFADDLDACVEMARRSAEPTHTHAEGIAGTIAIAVAAAVAWQTRDALIDAAREAIWEQVLSHTPKSETREQLERARRLGLDASVALASERLGNGSNISAQDTVPFCVWSICRNLRDFTLAMWETVEAFGDRDTTCAIVGGVLAAANPEAILPPAWIAHQEPLAGVPLSEEHPRYR